MNQTLFDKAQVNREAIQLGSKAICWVSATRWLELAELIHEGEEEHAEASKQKQFMQVWQMRPTFICVTSLSLNNEINWSKIKQLLQSQILPQRREQHKYYVPFEYLIPLFSSKPIIKDNNAKSI